jgi:muramoyltetrapeptide carboxypeptidase LdcA involved in peptidoglycan recycling
MNLICPGKVKKGDTAYIISPSAGIMPFARDRVLRAEQNLEKLGLKVRIGSHADKNSGYVSASVAERVADIHEAFLDNRCTLIIASIGGNHSNQLLSQLDYSLIAENPKTFVGYSDNTVLHLALLSQSKLQTFYGPCFMNQFGEFPGVQEYTLADFKEVALHKRYMRTVTPSALYTDEILDWFKNEDASRPRQLLKNRGWEWWHSGNAKGWALPVAIPSINHVLGTKYMPNVQGAVLMIDIPEGNSMHEGMSVADVDSWLTDLANAGVFDKVRGLVIGRPYKYDPSKIKELKAVVMRIVQNHSFPVLFNLDFGHTDPMITIPIGAQVTMDSQSSSLQFN